MEHFSARNIILASTFFVFAVSMIFMIYSPQTFRMDISPAGSSVRPLVSRKHDEANFNTRQNLTGRFVVTNLLHTNSTSILANDGIRARARKLKSGITSAKTSSYQVINYNYDNGDPYKYIHVRITARDNMKNIQLGGGDFWTAIMTSDEFRTSGRIVDHENGTYSVFFVRAWEGTSNINITLIHSSAATKYYQTDIWPTFRLRYEGTFQHDKKKEKTICTISSTSDVWLAKPRCVYVSKTSLGNHVFTCDSPKNLPCSSLIYYGNTRVSNVPQNAVMYKLLKGKKMLFQGLNSAVLNGPDHVTLSTVHDNGVKTLPKKEHHSMSSGFWNKTKWVSLYWENIQYEDSQSVGECLRDKHVIFMGDSTMHLVFKALCKLLKVSHQVGKEDSDKFAPPSAIPASIYVEDYNTTLSFHFHQIRNGNPRYFSLSVFEAVVLDTLGYTNCDFIIGIGFGIHFTQWSKSAFEDRVLHIIGALSRLRSRCPNVPIIVKGPHLSGAIYQFDWKTAISRSDYIVKRMAVLMEKEFSRINVIFIDTWDLNLSFPSKPAIHMPEAAYNQELFLALSVICKRKLLTRV